MSPRYRDIDRPALRRRLVRMAELVADTKTQTGAVQLAALAEVLRTLSEDLQMPEVGKALGGDGATPAKGHSVLAPARETVGAA